MTSGHGGRQAEAVKGGKGWALGAGEWWPPISPRGGQRACRSGGRSLSFPGRFQDPSSGDGRRAREPHRSSKARERRVVVVGGDEGRGLRRRGEDERVQGAKGGR